jgi:hypothetical protein
MGRPTGGLRGIVAATSAMVEARTIKSQLAEERPQHDLMLPFARLDLSTFRAGNLSGHVPGGLVRGHRSLNLLK